ncbi:MAG: hypothetical protein QOI58_2147 [Thermoanaerobaculia bacterium]|jgi:hypothetical protein|nr:hypothetical protein [Thermoanaerobaculia bacterium]
MADDDRLHLRESGPRVGDAVSAQLEITRSATQGGGGGGRAGGGDGPRRLDTLDYLRAAIAATNRTRTVTMALVVASVILAIGVLNSLYHSWMGTRLLACADPDANYVIETIGQPPIAAVSLRDKQPYKHARELYEDRYQTLYTALTKSYVDTSFAIRVPFFGVAIDANDFGVVGGIGFFIILVMFDFSVRRETANLEVGFAHAKEEGNIAAFYDVLSMHQLFTLPPRSNAPAHGLTGSLPKVICCLPFVVQATIAAHDFATSGIGDQLSDTHMVITFWSEVTFLVLIVLLTTAVFGELRRIEEKWDTWAVERFPSVVSARPTKTRRERIVRWLTA